MSIKQLSVRLHGQPLANLEQTEQGHMQLTYRADATRALSLSLPIREEPYDDAACEAYFGGLLPESEDARKLIGQRHGANPRNSFALLRAIGHDCAGAVSLHDPGDPIAPDMGHPIQATPVSEAELAKHIRDLPRKPLFMDVAGMRLSLAGAQDKAALCVVDGQLALPSGGTPTTHILKPAIDRYEGTVFNEYLCLAIAAEVGLDAPAIEIRTAEDIPYLLLKRHDRLVMPEARIARIHQEGFCQALGVPSKFKYQAE